MEDLQKRKKKKKDNKPIYMLLGFLLVFGVFIYLITRPSSQSKAIKEIQTSFNKKDVEMVFYKYKNDLTSSNDQGEVVVDEEFLTAVRKKLSGFNLNEEELKECRSWLPPAPTSINLIVIPDLSRRITDTMNNPNQIENDIFVFSKIWNSFVNYSKLRIDTKDRLIVEVTDIDQAKGQFSKIANDLQFDLATHKSKSNRLYFTTEKDKQFKDGIIELYQSAKQKPLGADYRLYFRSHLGRLLKESTLFDTYINKVIIITDGYLEAEGKPADTRLKGYKPFLDRAVSIGNVLDVITSKGLNIPKENIDLSNTQILVCEVNERQYVPFLKIPYNGKGFDYDILKAYWEDWFTRMGAKKPLFIQKEQASDLTAKKIEEFISK